MSSNFLLGGLKVREGGREGGMEGRDEEEKEDGRRKTAGHKEEWTFVDVHVTHCMWLKDVHT